MWIMYLVLFLGVLQDEVKLPELNKKIVMYVHLQLGKKVGRGECWDLASQALNNAGASWDGAYGFGRVLNVKKDSIYPGDIIQFNKVKTSRKENDQLIKGSYPIHTAVVYQVVGNGVLKMAEQNTSEFGRKVGVSVFDTKSVVSGKVTFYRPIL